MHQQKGLKFTTIECLVWLSDLKGTFQIPWTRCAGKVDKVDKDNVDTTDKDKVDKDKVDKDKVDRVDKVNKVDTQGGQGQGGQDEQGGQAGQGGFSEYIQIFGNFLTFGKISDLQNFFKFSENF